MTKPKQYTLTVEAQAVVSRLAAACGRTHAEILSDALGHYAWTFDQVLAGGTIGVVKNKVVTEYTIKFTGK